MMRPSSFLFAGLLTVLTAIPALGAPILTVGSSSSYDYSTISAAVAYADSNNLLGAIIQIQPGTYLNDFSNVTVPLTLERAPSTSGAVLLNATQPVSKGIITSSADLTVNGLTFMGAANSNASGANAAGIRAQAPVGASAGAAANLTILNSIFQNNQDGVLVDANLSANESVTVANSDFYNNGVGSGPRAGYEHAIYVNQVSSLTVSGSLFCGTLMGHDIKTRAFSSTLISNTLYDGTNQGAPSGCNAGTTSYAVDFAYGGTASMTGNKLYQGSSTQNPSMVSYAAEGTQPGYSNSFISDGDTFLNTLPGNSIGINNHATIVAQVNCDTFTGLSTDVLGPAQIGCGTTTSPVPEPSSLSIMLAAIVGGALWGFGARKSRRSRG